MDVHQLEEALFPYEKILRAQEKRRKLLGVKEIDKPTYEKYIIAPIERFKRQKNPMATMYLPCSRY